MEIQYNNFGEFLHHKRIECKKTYRELAMLLDVSAPYISDIEKGRRNAPAMDKLSKLIDIFNLSDDEVSMMYNLAGKKKDTVAPDIPDYIKENDFVTVALRTARDLGATEKDWESFVEDLKRRKG
jgi:transcriptional regulator with XRE-family HTH domain